ncbi:nucleotidyltransferase domain-containing protein [Sphingomonas sp. RP10(2022)]|uniref:Nucleotidyltransferase domain-containing protein n=1 Tax=Sphingomonas liriopis TaxID=2949094 RepID=A0A9X2KRU1_9SPHN|nr:nucleotidyltransferase domain-containing protein [Sphingomonas liriopis]MCP3735986.1 nucleotidyltransferase domain-containing protein [Sphingomonas liriopis]
MSRSIDLTAVQRRRLLEVLGCFAPPVERVDVFGSRVRGTARPGSDVDLVVDGRIDAQTVRRIASALSDSYLGIFADVAAYSLLEDDDFAREVRRDAVPLFDAADLAAAPPFRPVDGLREWYLP